MSEATERKLKQWESAESDDDVQEDLFTHFEQARLSRWTDVAHEGVRVWNFMFPDKIHEDIPKGGVIFAVAAQAENCAYEAIGKALGVQSKAVLLAASWWAETDAPPVSPHEFYERCKALEEWLKTS